MLYIRGLGGAGGLQGLQGHIVGVIAHGGDSGDGVVAAVGGLGVGIGIDVVLDALVKLRVAALLIEGGDIQLYVSALGGLQDLVVVQGVGAQEGNVNAQLGGLGDDLGGVGDGDGGEDDLSALALGLVQVRGEVGVVLGEAVLDHGAAGGGEGLLKEGDQALVVFVALLTQQIGLLGAELLGGEVGQHGALEGIQEADAEVVVVAGGDVGIGAGDAHGGDAGVTEDGTGGDGDAGAVGAQNDAYTLADQLGGGGGGLISGGAVVGIDQLDLVGLTAQLHSGGLRVGELHPQHFLLAAGGGVAGGGLKYADLNNLVAVRGAGAGRSGAGSGSRAGTGAAGQSGQEQRCGKCGRKELFHVHSPLDLLELG